MAPGTLGTGNRLARFNDHREQIVALVAQRVVDDRIRAASAGGAASLEYVLNDVVFHEMLRLAERRDRRGRRQHAQWHQLATRLGAMSEADKRERLHELAVRCARDIAGSFSERVYQLTSRLLPTALAVAFSPLAWPDVRGSLHRIAERIQVQGPLELLRRLAATGTLVIAPTHSSNLDSIVIGFALERAGLPPCTYGAGKNLFTNPVISFFMRNLGAYRVDRRLRYALYKDVLKEYSTVLLEHGYHSLFFPGGTRCRSNAVEHELKLGLLGSALRAFENAQAPIYVVPATINYHLVLEADTLVADHLAEQGRSRYIIEDDEFSRIGRIVDFARRMIRLEESVVIRFGDPLDVLGNAVDERGGSVDRRGRGVDPLSYVRDSAGRVAHDPQRDRQYTRELGALIAAAYRRDTVLLSTHLVARALFDGVARAAGLADIYALLRVPRARLRLPIGEVAAAVARLRDGIAGCPSAGRVHERVAAMAPVEVVADGLRVFAMVPSGTVAHREGDDVCVDRMRLLYYYRNRTAHFEGG